MKSFSWVWLSESPLLVLLLLFIISHFFYQRYFRQTTPGMGSGIIIMSLSFFVLECMQPLHVPYFLIRLIALEILILWFYFAVELMEAYLHDEFSMDSLADRLSLGAWVSGTAITALLLHQTEKTLHGFIILLGIIALVLYLFYLAIMFNWLRMYLHKQFKLQANGLILLVTISTQTIAMLLNELFKDTIPAVFYQGMIAAGAVIYLLGLFVIVRYQFVARNGLAAVGWWNVNTLIYGAASITGLVMLESAVFPLWMVNSLGLFALFTFVIVAVIEVSRVILRVQHKGLGAGVLIYHPSQWYRVFSCGAAYAFVLSYAQHDYAKSEFLSWIATYGAYLVLALLLGQGILALWSVLHEEKYA